MTGFGVFIGLTGSVIAVAFGIPAAQVLRPSNIVVGVCGGFLLGLGNYRLVSWAVGSRLRVLTARLSAARSEIAAGAGTDSWKPLADSHALPVYSNDDFSQTMASFNYLMSSLDSSQLAERTLRQSLVEQAKLAALGTLTAGVAHETKNPLNFIVNFTELNLELCAEVREEVIAEDGAEPVSDLETNLDKILHHAQRALAVMATMLQVGRTHAGDALPCHLNEIVEQSAALADHSWRANRRDARCAIHVELDDNDPTVRGFEGDLVQVIINLVTNGLEAASSATDRGEVRISVQHDDVCARIVVTDNGPGIDAETLPHIFEPFFTTKYRSGGTGLGLSISKDIIDNRHHGHLDVTSEPGAGAQFVIKLPLKTMAAKVPVRA